MSFKSWGRCTECQKKRKRNEDGLCSDCWFEQASPEELMNFIKQSMEDSNDRQEKAT